MSERALPGFRDFYPEEFAERAHILRVWRDVARRFAFVEYDGPPLEPLDLYTRKSGEEIVGQLYNFTDKGDRPVALRPEMTPTFARMVAARAKTLRKPVRWFSIPQLFRYERQQKGRLREHFQLNVDIVGEAGVAADAELVAVAIEVMRALGLSDDDVKVRYSDRRILQAYLTYLGIPEACFAEVFGVIDKLGRQQVEVSERKLGELGVPRAAVPKVLELPHTTVKAVSSALQNWRDRPYVDELFSFGRYVAALTGEREDWLRFDMSIVRGLAYYTGIVFELFDTKDEFRAIAGGGRYDDLLQAIAGTDLPALGFGMGDVVLGELLRARGIMPRASQAPDVWIVAEEGVSTEIVMGIARELRDVGLSVEYPLRQQHSGKQTKAAFAVGAAVVLRVGPEFLASRAVQVALPRPHEAPSLFASLPSQHLVLDELITVIREHPQLVRDSLRQWQTTRS